MRPPQLAEVADRLWLLPGHLDLSRFEQTLAEQWPRVMATDNERALDVVLSLSALAHRAAESVAADLVLLDVGPSLGAINHSAMLACDNVVVPMAWDWFSLQALLNIGPSIKEWRDDWQTVGERFLRSHPYAAFATHRFQPIGYVLQQRINQPDMDSIGYEAIGENVQRVFRTHLLQKGRLQDGAATDPDEHRLAMVDHYAALAPLSQLFCKPMFDLTQADGAVGGRFGWFGSVGGRLKRWRAKFAAGWTFRCRCRRRSRLVPPGRPQACARREVARSGWFGRRIDSVSCLGQVTTAADRPSELFARGAFPAHRLIERFGWGDDWAGSTR